MPHVTRRERLRAETIADIKGTALRHLRAVGAAQLSLRQIASDMRMSPAGLYRYYASRDELLTALITDAFHQLAEAVATAREPGASPGARLLACAHAYRAWALEHPAEFGLVYGSPLPDYTAPADGPTQAAARAVGAVFFAEIEQACRDRGEVSVPPDPAGDLDPALAESVAGFATAFTPRLPPQLIPIVHGIWGKMHGLTILEVFHHMPWLVPDGQALFTAEMRRSLERLGIHPT